MLADLNALTNEASLEVLDLQANKWLQENPAVFLNTQAQKTRLF